MQCKFCFATFQDVKETILPKGHQSESESIQVVEELARAGFEKITFAGGEPTLCKWLPKLIKVAKGHGLTTMLVTNGTRLTEKYLHSLSPHLDWIALSVDSLNLDTQQAIGRVTKRNDSKDPTWIYDTAIRIKQAGIRFKVNTVVCSANWEEDMHEFISFTKPERWKIMQVLPIDGQNDGKVEDLLIPKSKFEAFVNRHQKIEEHGIRLVPECNEAMTSSYAMVDPAGRFFDNTRGRYTYSDAILKVGVTSALDQVNIDRARFIDREGVYSWV